MLQQYHTKVTFYLACVPDDLMFFGWQTQVVGLKQNSSQLGQRQVDGPMPFALLAPGLDSFSSDLREEGLTELKQKQEYSVSSGPPLRIPWKSTNSLEEDVTFSNRIYL